ncbi:amidase signature enzyme [Xylaria cf. heliscus]|nr:amidase signature enzyme [Xylaria cf. heliscus]
MSISQLNLLEATGETLRHLLDSGQTTSFELVEQYLAQIETHNRKLNALVSVIPRELALALAMALDEERRQGSVRSPLHGIPIILKDSFITASSLGMPSAAGAVVFADAKASKNSAIAQKLIDAGMIIMGKSNMTEFSGMKTVSMMPGWSAHGGQTISAYTGPIKAGERLLGHSAPGGSSTGSAVAVSAGFSPLAMGVEAIGSIITPAVRAALYAIKPTVGTQDTSGICKLSEFYDTPGPMAKCAADVINMTELLLGRPLHSSAVDNWEGISIGFLDAAKFSMAEEMCEQMEGSAEQMAETYETSISMIRGRGGEVKYPIDLPELPSSYIGGMPALIHVAYWDFKNVTIPEFINCFDTCHVDTLEDIINFNEQHTNIAMPEPFPGQDQLITSNTCNDAANDIAKLKQELRSQGRKILDDAFDSEDVNIIAAPGDSPLCVYAAVAGYPIAAVPLGQLSYNGRPFGICLVAQENEEKLLLRFMSAFELLFPPRPVPSL